MNKGFYSFQSTIQPWSVPCCSAITKLKPKPRPKVDLPRDREILVDWDDCETIVPEGRNKEYHLFAELCLLSSKDIPITCVAMLRVFLEMTVKQTGIAMGLQPQKLSTYSNHVAKRLLGAGYIDKGVAELIKQYSDSNEGLFSISNIQSHIHSARFHPNQSKANSYWDELDPFLAGCWRFIQDKDNN